MHFYGAYRNHVWVTVPMQIVIVGVNVYECVGVNVCVYVRVFVCLCG